MAIFYILSQQSIELPLNSYIILKLLFVFIPPKGNQDRKTTIAKDSEELV